MPNSVGQASEPARERRSNRAMDYVAGTLLITAALAGEIPATNDQPETIAEADRGPREFRPDCRLDLP